MTDTGAGNLAWLLEGFATSAPGTMGALVTSNDGLPLHLHGFTQEGAERVSAIVSGLASLGRGLDRIPGLDLPSGGSLEQVVIYHGNGRLLVGRAGDQAILAVLTRPDAEMSVIAYQMEQLAARLPQHLGTSVRRPKAG
ncbi:roadblock/LC7 domain-containing protein [Streptomyces yaizuensis]|uniref:Roadblock/LC7 domain-containing protein n=1 Tax=Streptomyces yaizuensis TaxID=2989713 RepID=A0ABQ5P6D6_9ACTN|nr:roadblock/LC7 domain-containing protein [Streptomyces sp. YSPA8]GLF98129.1 roadblock/LC7 domain-containing protein [Streptomyces sp. YSPA8]